MRTAYKVFAYLVALGVVVQAAMMVWAIAGLGIWVDKDGGVLDKAAIESEDSLFPAMAGFVVHSIDGMMIIPALALILLIVSFFAKVPGGTMWAGLVLLAVVVQVSLGLFGHEVAFLGMLHGINALVLFSLAVMAGVRVNRATSATPTPTQRETV